MAHGSPLARPLTLSKDIYIWNEQLRKMGLISPLWPRARPSCGCRVNLSQMRWLEPDPLSQIPSPCTLEPHEISKLKPSVIGVSPTLHESNSNVMLWNVRRAMWRNMCWWTREMTCRWNKVEGEIPPAEAEPLFTVIVTVVGVKWNAAVNSSLSGPTFGVFHFYEAEEDICLCRWPLQEFSGDLLIIRRDL